MEHKPIFLHRVWSFKADYASPHESHHSTSSVVSRHCLAPGGLSSLSIHTSFSQVVYSSERLWNTVSLGPF